VEGSGLYVEDQEKLMIKSYEKQYQELTELLKEIPRRIKIITIPGEHDAAQLAIPQPAIDKKVGETLYTLPNLQNHGNPLRLSINGIKFLIYHAQNCEMIFENLMKIERGNPIKGIKELLEYRHLAPEYGSYVNLAPYKKDYLVIDEIPDVMVVGHFHQTKYEEYNGVKIVTCGTFQRAAKKDRKTEKQHSEGEFPIIDTRTGEITILDLKKLNPI
jgi:DNA polymerase II small subunit